MSSMIDASLAFPSVIFSLMLTVVLIYWFCVVLGLLEMDLFDFDADIGGDVDVDIDADAEAHGFADVLARLDLTEIPLTVSISLFTLVAWVCCVSAVQLVGALATSLVMGSGLAVGTIGISTLVTSRLAVFLKPLFRVHFAPTRSSLIGKTCRITTLEVTERHGQAEVADGGAGLIIQVRSSNAAELSRGAEALIFNYDAESEIFSVKPLGSASNLDRDPAAARRGN